MIGDVEFYIVLFAVYSFLGWLIEVVYRSSDHKQFINAGFMHGPFVPVYGFGAILIVFFEYLMAPIHIAARLALYFILLSLLEYIAGFLLERLFRIKLWDYSGYRFNIHGRVSLLFSFYWAGLAFIFVQLIHPVVSEAIAGVERTVLNYFSMAFVLYLTVDISFSVVTATSFKRKISYLFSEYMNLENFEIDKIMNSFKRFYRAFPDLNEYIKNNMDINLKKRISGFLDNVQEKVISGLSGRKPVEQEYMNAVSDILNNEEFLKLKNFFHHNSSIYEHVLRVSYFSYSICKFLKLDYISAARGGLLHDFFLYDWRNHDEPDLARHKFHGLEHSKIAFFNSEKYFKINDIEKDIILRHMWPLTLFPPRYRESFIVNFADKYVSSREFVDEFAKSARETGFHDRKRSGPGN